MRAVGTTVSDKIKLALIWKQPYPVVFMTIGFYTWTISWKMATLFIQGVTHPYPVSLIVLFTFSCHLVRLCYFSHCGDYFLCGGWWVSICFWALTDARELSLCGISYGALFWQIFTWGENTVIDIEILIGAWNTVLFALYRRGRRISFRRGRGVPDIYSLQLIIINFFCPIETRH